MKRILSIVFQFLLLLLVFFVGSLLPSLPTGVPMWRIGLSAGHYFVLDGLIFMLLVYLLLLAVSAVRRRSSGLANSSIALLLALLAGFLLRIGFMGVS